MATAEELLAQHATQGLKVRDLKAAKDPAVAAAVQDLLKIKAAYKELTGEDVPGAGGGKSKKDKKKKGGAPPAAAAAPKEKKAPKEKQGGPAPAAAAVKKQPKTTASAQAAAAPAARAGGMYTAPLYSTTDKVDMPASMYSAASFYDGIAPKLPPQCGAAYTPPGVGGASADPAAVTALNTRYDKILSDLNTLTQTADKEILKRGGTIPTAADVEIHKRGGTVASGAAGAATETMVGKHGEILDPTKARAPSAVVEMTLFANPASFVRTPLVLVEYLRNQGKTVDVRQYWHGCNGMVGTVPAPEFVQAERSRPRVSCDLRVNLIWKNVPRTKMVVSPSHHVPIEGDANVAKYMCRVLCPALYSADVVEATEIDHLLDLADSIVGASSRNQKPALKQANQKLGKNEYLGGVTMSLADLHLWSCVAVADASCDKNLKKWKAALDGIENLQPQL